MTENWHQTSYNADFKDPHERRVNVNKGQLYENTSPQVSQSRAPQSRSPQSRSPQSRAPQSRSPQPRSPQSRSPQSRPLPATSSNFSETSDKYDKRVHTHYFDRDSKPLDYQYRGRGPETYAEYKEKLTMGRNWVKPDVTGRKSQYQQSSGYSNNHDHPRAPRPHEKPTLDDQKSPIIERIEWGYVRVKGAPVDYGDVQLGPRGCREWDWKQYNTHHVPGVTTDDAKEMLKQDIQVLVICTGYDDRLQVPRDTEELILKSGVELHYGRPQEVVNRYNNLAEKGVRIAALIHSTC